MVRSMDRDGMSSCLCTSPSAPRPPPAEPHLASPRLHVAEHHEAAGRWAHGRKTLAGGELGQGGVGCV